MRCPVHHVEGCYCAFASKPGWPDPPAQAAEHPLQCDCDACLNGRAAHRRQLNLLALTFAGALIACSSAPAPKPCAPDDYVLAAHEADCLARVKDECAGIPADQSCPFEDACKAFTRERCK